MKVAGGQIFILGRIILRRCWIFFGRVGGVMGGREFKIPNGGAWGGGRRHRASAEQVYVVLEARKSFLLSSQQSKAIEPQAAYDRPQPMPREPLWLCE